MSRLPNPGSDSNIWGHILNDYLSQSLTSDGSLKDGVVSANQIQDGAIGDSKVSSLSQSKIINLTIDLAEKANASATVNLTGDQTITGIKNFTGTLQKNGKALAAVDDLLRNVKDYGAVGDGATDDSTAVANAIAATLTTGGTVFFPPGTYKLLPGSISLSYNASGVERQKPLRLVGVGGDWRTTTGSDGAPSGGSILDFQGTPQGRGVGCIETFGTGYMEIEGLYFYQSGTAHTIPYIYSTNTTLLIHNNCFQGHLTKSGTSCDQDAILLGAVSPPDAIVSTENSRFQGYGTVIGDNWFNRMRRCVWGRRASNGVVVRDNTVWNACGSDGGSAASSGAAIEFQGVSVSSTVGATIIGNLIEMTGYYHGIRLGAYTANCNVAYNNFYDPEAQTTAYVNIGTTNSLWHSITAGYHPDTVTFVDDSSSTATIINPHQTQATTFAQLVRFTKKGSAGNEGVRVTGNIALAGGAEATVIQPATDQLEGASLLRCKRSAADDVAPGQDVVNITQSGNLSLTNSANATTTYGVGNIDRSGSGGPFIINTGTGGSNLDLRGFAARFMHFSTNNELLKIRIAPHSSTNGALQFQATGPIWTTCSGTPEGQVTAPIGSICTRTDGAAGTTLYIKESGTGNTGWVAK